MPPGFNKSMACANGTGQVAEVEHDGRDSPVNLHRQRFAQRFMPGEMQRAHLRRHPLPRFLQRRRLHIKGMHVTARRNTLAQEKRVVPISHGGIHDHIARPQAIREHELRPAHRRRQPACGAGKTR